MRPYLASRNRSVPKNWGRVITRLRFLDSKLIRRNTGANVVDVLRLTPEVLRTLDLLHSELFWGVVGFCASGKQGQAPSAPLRAMCSNVTVAESGIRADAGGRRQVSNLGVRGPPLLIRPCPMRVGD